MHIYVDCFSLHCLISIVSTVEWPLKVLYTHISTLMAEAAMEGADLAIGSNLVQFLTQGYLDMQPWNRTSNLRTTRSISWATAAHGDAAQFEVTCRWSLNLLTKGLLCLGQVYNATLSPVIHFIIKAYSLVKIHIMTSTIFLKTQ